MSNHFYVGPETAEAMSDEKLLYWHKKYSTMSDTERETLPFMTRTSISCLHVCIKDEMKKRNLEV